jgi:uncharacterized protein (TIGR03435 family)
MVASNDMELVAAYACARSEEAFASLVSRHVNLVYSVALRHVGNPHQAEEISQAVFMILARKAGTLRKGTVLSGWLYHTARLTAANYVRSEISRARREQEAHMQSLSDQPEPDAWGQIAPLLDGAMADLNEKDRNALVLRFFNSMSFREVGTSLGSSEDAAKMRVNRAVEKLRNVLARKGVALSTTVLCSAIAAQSVQAAPVALATSVTASVLHCSATSASLLPLIKGTIEIMAWTKAKTAVVIATGVLLGTGTATVAVKEILDHRTYPWQVQNLNTAILNQVPPQVRIVPSKFPASGGWGTTEDKVMGLGQPLQTVLLAAYNETSPYRIVSSSRLPEDKYDFIANLADGSRPALQREINRKFGLTARRETRETEVLRLTVKKAGSAGLAQSLSKEGGSAQSGGGQFSCVNQPLSCLTSMLENYLGVPVVDHTGLAGTFDIDLAWEEGAARRPNPDGIKQALLDELGLELIPAKEPIDMLVVQKSR